MHCSVVVVVWKITHVVCSIKSDRGRNYFGLTSLLEQCEFVWLHCLKKTKNTTGFCISHNVAIWSAKSRNTEIFRDKKRLKHKPYITPALYKQSDQSLDSKFALSKFICDLGTARRDEVWFVSMKHCIVTCFASCLDRVLETGNMLNEDMGFLIKLLIVNLSSQSKLYFHKVSWRLVGSPLPVFKGECCLLLLLASQSVETYCLHADWIFALWGVNPPSSSKGMLHSFLKFWLANQESKPLRANEWMPLVKIFIYICVCFPLCSV